MLSFTVVFYAEKGDLETSDALLEYAISICSDNHVTYLGKSSFPACENALAEEKPQEQILELLQDARAYAKSIKPHLVGSNSNIERNNFI